MWIKTCLATVCACVFVCVRARVCTWTCIMRAWACLQALMVAHCGNSSRQFALGVETLQPPLAPVPQAKRCKEIAFIQNRFDFLCVIFSIFVSTSLKGADRSYLIKICRQPQVAVIENSLIIANVRFAFCVRYQCRIYSTSNNSNNRLHLNNASECTVSTLNWTHYSLTPQSHWWW